MGECKIIDISAWQTSVPYSSFSSYDIKGAILRITEKNNKIDGMFKTHHDGLIEAGIQLLGGYKFSYAMSVDEIITEANKVVEVLKEYPDMNGKVVYLDLEYEPQSALGKTALTEMIHAFEDVIVSNGYKFGIYANVNWIKNILDSSLAYDYWVASYPSNDNGEIVEKIRPKLSGQVGWQYTAAFNIEGEQYDMSIFDLDYASSILGGALVEKPKENTQVTAEDVLNIMRGWIGLSRSDLSHKPIIDIYNSYLPHPRGYTANYLDDFCCITISACFIKANAVSLIGGVECGVEMAIQNCFKPKGIWIEDDDITPIVGDIICFYWNETNKEKDNTGFASHIGIVEYVEDNIIHTIEGNTSGGKVARRTYEIGQACIRGFARPKYAIKQEMPTTTPIETAPTNLKKGSVSEEVKTMQSMLSACGYNLGEYGIDGDFGADTEEAIKFFQTEHKLEVTGEYDQPTKNQLEKSYDNSQKEIPSAMFCIKSPKTYMRKGPSKDYEITKMLPVGTKVRILSSKKVGTRGKLWYRIKRGEVTGWIVASSLRV